MSPQFALLGGAVIGMASATLCLPLTRRELAAAVGRATDEVVDAGSLATKWHRNALIVASGLLLGLVLYRAGWAAGAIPPLLLVLALVQLGFCDLTRRLLPKTMVHATSAAVIVSGIVVAGLADDWPRFFQAVIGAGALFGLLFVFNLMNPAWMAFGDVRLAPAVGFGLAWVSPMALVEGFFVANMLVAVVGITMIVAHKAERRTGLPFGFYLALGAAATILYWS